MAELGIKLYFSNLLSKTVTCDKGRKILCINTLTLDYVTVFFHFNRLIYVPKGRGRGQKI